MCWRKARPHEIAANRTVQSAYLGALYGDLVGEKGGRRWTKDPIAAELILEVYESIHTFIGQFHILEGVSLRVQAQQHHRPAGAQRRRQDHHPQVDSGPHPAPPGPGDV